MPGLGYFGTVVSGLYPTSTVTLTKSGSNPTFNFAGDSAGPVPENIVKVGSTYYCVYAGIGATTIRLASASSSAGPWTDLGSLFSAGSGWEASQALVAPCILEDSGTFYIYYSTEPVLGGGTGGSVGVATSSTVTGPYTKYASNPIFTPSAAGLWDSLQVGEVSVINVGGAWTMAYMGENTAHAYGASEKVGFATASSPYGPWTRAAGNPLIDWGAGGAWDNALTADPFIFYVNGYYWCWYTGGQPTPWHAGLAYASTPTGTWTKLAANPLLSPGGAGTFDEHASWRGGIYIEAGVYTLVYGGINGAVTQDRGGNAVLNVSN